ncbi:MAG TPA: MFS transporter, partial [Ramlibacter sp.]|nr:MFS transporter [Ramlibacter sp.]
MQSDVPQKLSMAQVLTCGAAVVTLSMGIRHGFGLWLQPITQAQGWTRETFAFALAIQNLAWGVSGIFAGMAADRFGAFRVLIAGALFYSAGLIGMALSPTGLMFTLTTGVLLGVAQAGTTYAVIYGVIGRQIDPARRSWAMGIAAAAGSFGQFLMVPVEGFLISGIGWQQALLALGVAVLLIVPLAFGLREPGFTGGSAPRRDQTIAQALREAFKYPSFQLLMAGYFVCGFQVVFIGVHMPSYLKDKGLSPQVASYALALIGLFNVVGTYAAGALGQRLARRKILAFIYLSRSVAIALFLLAPVTPLSVYLFSGVMGLLWLSTVPATNATVAQ